MENVLHQHYFLYQELIFGQHTFIHTGVYECVYITCLVFNHINAQNLTDQSFGVKYVCVCFGTADLHTDP